jgi:hypothetical protein
MFMYYQQKDFLLYVRYDFAVVACPMPAGITKERYFNIYNMMSDISKNNREVSYLNILLDMCTASVCVWLKVAEVMWGVDLYNDSSLIGAYMISYIW